MESGDKNSIKSDLHSKTMFGHKHVTVATIISAPALGEPDAGAEWTLSPGLSELDNAVNIGSLSLPRSIVPKLSQSLIHLGSGSTE